MSTVRKTLHLFFVFWLGNRRYFPEPHPGGLELFPHSLLSAVLTRQQEADVSAQRVKGHRMLRETGGRDCVQSRCLDAHQYVQCGSRTAELAGSLPWKDGCGRVLCLGTHPMTTGAFTHYPPPQKAALGVAVHFPTFTLTRETKPSKLSLHPLPDSSTPWLHFSLCPSSWYSGRTKNNSDVLRIRGMWFLLFIS